MLDFEKVSKVFFSPSGTTEKIVSEVAKNFNMNMENYDLLSFDDEKEFKDELVIVGIPVFNGRIPKTACRRLQRMKGNDTKCIVILNYGNMCYGDALLELTSILKENNFNIVAVATTISQNSLFKQIATNRPDDIDLEQINKFSQKIIEKLKNNDEKEIFVSGYKPYPEHIIPQFAVKCDEGLCTECLDCVYTCPEDAIMENTPTMTKLNDCSRCSTCINVCSEGARSFSGPRYEIEREYAMDNFYERKQPEFFL